MSAAPHATTTDPAALDKPTRSRPAPNGAPQESAMISSIDPQGETTSIALHRIDANPFQHRQTMDEQKMEELVSAIQSQGLLQRPLVRAFGARYQLAFCHRRKEAYARLLERTKDPKWAHLPVVLRQEMPESEMQLFNLAENLSVEDPPVVEIAAGIAQYQRTNGLSLTQLAEKLGQKEVRLKRLLRLHMAPTVIKNGCSEGLMVDDGDGHKERRRLDMRACLELFRLYTHYQVADPYGAEGQVGAVVEKALTAGWSLRQIETVVAKDVGGQSAEAAAVEPEVAPAMKVTANQITFFRTRLVAAPPAVKKEARKLIEEILLQLA